MAEEFKVKIQGFIADGNRVYDGDQCPDCGTLKVCKSPCGDWCNACGWACPGYDCPECGRKEVNTEHLTLEGVTCRGLENGK